MLAAVPRLLPPVPDGHPMSRLASRTEAQRPARTVSPESRMESHQKVHVWPRPASWTERSACAGEDPDLFDATPPPYSGADPHVIAAPALKICDRCPVQAECRELGDSLPRVTRAHLIFGGHLYGVPERGIQTYDPCAGPCGRPLRKARETREDYPDTVKHRGDGLCTTCYFKKNGTY